MYECPLPDVWPNLESAEHHHWLTLGRVFGLDNISENHWPAAHRRYARRLAVAYAVFAGASPRPGNRLVTRVGPDYKLHSFVLLRFP